MREAAVTLVKQAAGYGLLLLGVSGFLLPFIPSFPFLLAAVAILGTDHRLIRPWYSRLPACILNGALVSYFRLSPRMNSTSASRKS